MAGLTITVGGVDITAYIDVYSIVIDDIATHLVGTARFSARDHTGTIGIDAKDAITIVDDGTTLFGGEVVEATLSADGVAKEWHVVCQDYNIILTEVVVETDTYTAGTSDADIIDDLFTTYYSDIDSTTYVSEIDASMEEMTFRGMTLQEILDEICARTGGRYYVDVDKNLHYFTTEANNASFSLSTSPDMASSFPFGEFRKTETSSRLVNKVFVLGLDVSGWSEDAASIATYGERHGVSRDNRITTSQGVTDRGTQILDRYDLPRTTYECWTEKDGLAAGQSVTIVHATLGINTAFYIRKITTRFMSADADTVRRHHLILDDEPILPEVPRRNINLRVMSLETVVTDLNETVFDTDPPSTPTFNEGNMTTGVDLDADGHQLVYIQCTWGAVGDADLAYYQCQISTSSDFSGYTFTRDHGADGSRIERFLGVLGSTVYYARVRAVDWVGNASDWSGTLNLTSAADTSAPAQVVGLAAAGSRTLIGVSWTANSEADLKHYEIQRADDVEGAAGEYSTIATALLNFYVDQDFTDEEMDAEDTFWYKVRAVDTSGNAGDYSAETSASLSKIIGDMIAAATIIGDHIAANTITANKLDVAELSAISANLGTCTAGTVTGATIRTASSGARIVLDSTNGIQAYNATPTQTVSILPSGAGWIGTAGSIAWNTAGGMTIDGGLLVDGTIVAGAFTNAIGQPLFSAASGILLLGPYAQRLPTAWKTSRGQVATLAGALHEEQGAWLGTRGLQIEEGTVNYVENPIFENDVTSDWTLDNPAPASGQRARSQTQVLFGNYSCKLTANNGDYVTLTSTDGVAVPDGDDVTVTAYVWQDSDIDVSLILRDSTNGANRATDSTSRVQQWVRLEATWNNNTGLAATCHLQIKNNEADDTSFCYIDGCQLELKDHPTTLAHGGMGSGYAWGGTAHNSDTTRTATTCNLDAMADLVSSNATQTHHLVFQAPYDHDGTWPGATLNVLWDLYDAGSGDRLRLHYNPTAETFGVYIMGGYRLTSSAQTFSAGDWITIDVKVNFTGNSYKLFVNGEEDDSDETSLTAPVVSQWNLGTAYDDANTANVVVAEYAVFETLITADEIAAMYVLNRPLIDAGALDLPGIYLQDGRFRLSSSSTGARTEIDVDGIKAYSSSAKTVAIETDGDAFFGSDITAASTTAIGIFANAQTYNGEAMGAGDVLFGDNSASTANLLWDKSAGQLKFRSQTTTQVYIDTTGALMAGGGAIKISAAANVLFSVASANQGIAWFSDAFSTGAGYIRVETAGNNDMRIVTGDTAVAGYSDFYLQNESSDGTRTPIFVDASEKQIGLYGASGHTLAVRNNNDGAWSALYAQMVTQDKAVAYFDQDVDGSPVFRADGGASTITASAGSIAEYMLVNINGTDRKIAIYAVS